METPPGILVRDLSLHFGGVTVFEGLSFEIAAQKFTALLGPSGVGKTTLLRIIAGLEAPATGGVAATDRAPLAGRIAYMAQQDFLLPWASALRNVMLGATLRGARPEPERALHLLERVGLGAQAHALPQTLSGGMRQRVALARTLYEDRPIVLMDEPFSALDSITRLKIQNLAAELLAGRTVLLITHDPLEACRLGHALFVLSGAPARLSEPLHVPGPPPRAADDIALLQTQGALMRTLTEAAAP
ncbi:nitrate/sulfonate/bicarbonate ABC transporter ATP-binding protein [Acidocella aquatica]|uniref:Nitrate/sulfonate/bicarbonate ABC transporter ATP-binding protein n=1 Tax=Acidocella aquatica TaxID=1922313 RepID=A0ABQ6A0L2_9PROT|nr:ABC transporter ATP-binding protein [Acidocella aquatica]GLR65719.1 nitrate/sulfonate/bicarbonate ABC transporter ATP-binding protein [Acidocella aquatica]